MPTIVHGYIPDRVRETRPNWGSWEIFASSEMRTDIYVVRNVTPWLAATVTLGHVD